MFGRQVKSELLPSIQFHHDVIVRPTVIPSDNTPTAPNAILKPGSDVWFKKDPEKRVWSPGKVQDLPGVTSATIESNDRKTYRRNIQHIKDRKHDSNNKLLPEPSVAQNVPSTSGNNSIEPLPKQRLVKQTLSDRDKTSSQPIRSSKRVSRPPVRYDPAAVKPGMG